MTPDVPPMKREDLEAKVTALLLGELPPDEAALLRELIARDAGLARLHDRLKLSLELLRETIATAEPAPPEPLKLSHEKREKLLAQFKTVAPKEFAEPAERKTSWVFVIAAVASMALLASLTIPTLSGGKSRGQGTLGAGRAEGKSFLGLHWFGGSKDDEAKRVPLYDAPAATASPAPANETITPNANVIVAGGSGGEVTKSEPAQQTPSSASQIVLPAPGADDSRSYAPLYAPAATPPPFAPGGIAANTPLRQEEALDRTPRENSQSAQALLGGDRKVPQDSNGRVDELSLSASVDVEKAKKEANLSTDLRDATEHPSGNGIVLPASAPASGNQTIALSYANPSDSSAAMDDLSKSQQTNAAQPQPTSPNSPFGGAGTLGIGARQRRGYRGSGNAPIAGGFGGGGGAGGGGNGQSIGGTIPQVTTASPANVALPILGDAPVAGALLAEKESKKTADTIAIGRPGNGQVGSSKYYIDKDTGKTVVIADAQSTRSTFANNLSSNQVEAINGVGYINGYIDLSQKAVVTESGRQLVTDSKKPGVADKIDAALPQPAVPPPVPQPEVLTSTNIFSTFSLNVSDASFKLAAASLQNGVMPDAASIRSEEFINAFDYRDPEPAPGAPIGFAWERAGNPFAHNRDLLRFSVKTAAQGRQEGRPLNLVLLLDKSGSMERADRVEIIHQALSVLASQLHAQDTLSVVVFARTARLWVDGVPGSQAGEVAQGLSRLTPEGGTDLEQAMNLAYATASRHYTAKGDNRVVLLTDGAANLGDVNPETLQKNVEANSKQGIALDCFGVGWDGYNDNLMETLSRAGHGRYGFINTPEEAATEFAGKLAGALRVAASDVKVQVEFNPNRVTAYRQIGYARHQLTAQQFRDNTVAAAQIGAAESGNALYTVEVNPAGDGPLCTVRVRFRLPGTTDYQEHAWDVPYNGTALALDQASPSMRLAGTASAFSEWLASSPYAGEVTPDQLLADLRGVPEVYGADTLPKKLEWMIRQAKSISGK